eukprot:CAMPEP_0113532756 /NCGR_PEP_ID=MMETSP0015_2-20120614/4232_1 /TAXON_ID=2838 /ORGANISM="Odontella" /LENGTH=296 /DNA_ID=CAMNT_0000431745 /DNA_START=136 /DNA_END=1026 /DNA_ORIENTATION=- /assembly_acc=CAM_ASM_000160
MRLLSLDVVPAAVLLFSELALPVSSFSPNTALRHFGDIAAAFNAGRTAHHYAASPRGGRMDDDDDFEFQAGGFKPETSFGAEAVPEAQRPANEYLDLTRSPLFGWADQERGDQGLAIRLGAVYAAFAGIVCWPIAGATFTQDGYLLNQIAATNVGALTVVLLLIVRLYSGWGYVGSRLQSKVIEFEETGWYDGDIEYKTDAEKARDLFLYRQDVKPVEDRLKTFALAIGVLWLVSIVGLNAVSSVNPLFDQYNLEMLKTLQYDDKLANTAAESSGGKPAYCDSRYYRAIANGGQGC